MEKKHKGKDVAESSKARRIPTRKKHLLASFQADKALGIATRRCTKDELLIVIVSAIGEQKIRALKYWICKSPI